MEDTMAFDEANNVSVLALCEPNHLFLQPGRLYRFQAIPGCEECAKLAAVFEDEK